MSLRASCRSLFKAAATVALSLHLASSSSLYSSCNEIVHPTTAISSLSFTRPLIEKESELQSIEQNEETESDESRLDRASQEADESIDSEEALEGLIDNRHPQSNQPFNRMRRSLDSHPINVDPLDSTDRSQSMHSGSGGLKFDHSVYLGAIVPLDGMRPTHPSQRDKDRDAKESYNHLQNEVERAERDQNSIHHSPLNPFRFLIDRPRSNLLARINSSPAWPLASHDAQLHGGVWSVFA